MDVAEHELQGLYTWVDEIPLSRPKKNIGRDFSDGVLVAEVIHHYYPKLVELHNYSGANALQQKMYNWNTLNQKVFKRLGFVVSKTECEAVSNCQPGAIERLLKLIKVKIHAYKEDPSVAAGLETSRAPKKAVPKGPGYGDPPAGPERHMAASPPTGMAGGGGGGMPPGYGPSNGGAPHLPMIGMRGGVSPELLAEKDRDIAELRETNEILDAKVRKLEQLVRLKDAKIQTLMAKLQAAGMGG